MKPPIKIGVLGGIGPEATGEFYSKLISEFQNQGLIKSNKDYPQIIINSIPAPELINNNISEKDLLPYIEGLKELDEFNPDFIVMVCNTIHLFYDALQAEIKTLILDLRKEVRDSLEKREIKSCLILGTSSTINRRLYDFSGIIKPDREELKILSEAIFNFNKGENREEQIKITNKICKKYLSLGAKTILLGCTEFAVMLDKANIPKINTIDILVEATIRNFIKLKEVNKS